MSEEIKKNSQDAELNLDDLDKVTGGAYFHTDIKCPNCGSENIQDVHQAHMTICLDCGHEW